MGYYFPRNISYRFISPSVTTWGDYVIFDGLPYMLMQRYIALAYGNRGFLGKFITTPNSPYGSYTSRGKIPLFFVPEMYHIFSLMSERAHGLSNYRYKTFMKLIMEKTWFGDSIRELDPKEIRVDMDAVIKELRPDFKLRDYQEEFIRDIYPVKTRQMHLRGYLLSLPMGAGKSSCSLALGVSLHKKHVVIIAPLTTVKNVWVTEIENIFRNKKKIWNCRDNSIDELRADTQYVIMNYEYIAKAADKIIQKFNPEDTLIIVDECHNFKDIKSLRTTELVKFQTNFKCGDLLLMSGTPIKALGVEVLPILKLLDPFYNDNVEEQLRALIRYRNVMNKLLSLRLGLLMFRKQREEILKLPEKHEEELKVVLPDGDKYTLPNVIALMQEFMKQRIEFYTKSYAKYKQDFEECMIAYRKTITTKEEKEKFDWYLQWVEKFSKMNGIPPDLKPLYAEHNAYQKKVIRPALPPNLRKKLDESSTVVKCLKLKVMGEALGQIVGKLRAEMTSKLIGEDVFKIIEHAEKKTILFTDYLAAIKMADTACKKAKFNPIVLDGSNSNQAKEIIGKFKASPDINPLIASIKVLATGHTIIEANTVIFLNVPFRSVDYEQASDRVYRIGQDTDVYIYKLVLDTGEEGNLSTRMQDILKWSEEQFGIIVEGMDISDQIKDGIKTIMTKETSPAAIFESISNFVGNLVSKFI